MKKIVRFLMVCFAVLVVTGCSMSDSRAEALLHKKYNEEFSVISSRKGTFSSSIYFVKSEKNPDICFRMEGTANDFSDTYISRLICGRMAKQVEENLGNIDTYVCIEPMLTGTLLTDPNSSLDDFIDEGPNKFTIFAFLNKNTSSESVLKEFPHMLDGISPINGSVAVYLMDKKDMEEVKEYVKTHDDFYEEFFEWTDSMFGGTILFENSSLPVSEISEGYEWLEELE